MGCHELLPTTPAMLPTTTTHFDKGELWGGGCAHEEIADDSEHNLPWFDRRDKDFQALQEVVLAPRLLASLKYYVSFRLEIKSYLPWFWKVTLSYGPFRERMEYSTYYFISVS